MNDLLALATKCLLYIIGFIWIECFLAFNSTVKYLLLTQILVCNECLEKSRGGVDVVVILLPWCGNYTIHSGRWTIGPQDGQSYLWWEIALILEHPAPWVLPYTNILILWSFNIFLFSLKLAELVFVRIDIRFMCCNLELMHELYTFSSIHMKLITCFAMQAYPFSC